MRQDSALPTALHLRFGAALGGLILTLGVFASISSYAQKLPKSQSSECALATQADEALTAGHDKAYEASKDRRARIEQAMRERLRLGSHPSSFEIRNFWCESSRNKLREHKASLKAKLKMTRACGGSRKDENDWKALYAGWMRSAEGDIASECARVDEERRAEEANPSLRLPPRTGGAR